MKKIKTWSQFRENAASTASSSTGAGGVSSAQVGALPGTPGVPGSGDNSFYMLDKKGKKIKKGSPSEVSDLRYLEPAKGITKLKESQEIETEKKALANEILYDLKSDGFEVTLLSFAEDREWFDADEGEKDYFDYEEVLIGLHKTLNIKWMGNISIRYKFDKNGITDKRISSIRNISEKEQKVVDEVEYAALQLINQLDYDNGTFSVSFDAIGSAMPWNETRMLNNNINITLWRKK
jgi:hypothetical protein